MREVLEMALDALEMHVPHVYKDRGYGPITAIKEVLAQPEQKPLAKVEPCAVCGEGKARLCVIRSCDTCHSEYAGQAEMKVALAQPVQEPFITKTGCGVLTLHSGFDDLPDGTKFYTTPPKRPWVELTDEDIALIDWESLATKKDCVQAIEAKLKELNT